MNNDLKILKQKRMKKSILILCMLLFSLSAYPIGQDVDIGNDDTENVIQSDVSAISIQAIGVAVEYKIQKALIQKEIKTSNRNFVTDRKTNLLKNDNIPKTVINGTSGGVSGKQIGR